MRNEPRHLPRSKPSGIVKLMNRKGLSPIEVLVAVMIFGAVLLGGVYLFSQNHPRTQSPVISPTPIPATPTSTPVSIPVLSTLPSISSDTSAFSETGFPVAGLTIIDIRPAPYNFTTISTQVGGITLSFIQPTKVIALPTSNRFGADAPTNEDRKEYFAYHGKNYEDKHIQTGGGGNGGEVWQDTYSIQTPAGSWKNLFSLNNSNSRYIIGYGNNLIVANDAYWNSGYGRTGWTGWVGIFDSDTNTTSTISRGYSQHDPFTDITDNHSGPISLVVTSGTLSIRIGLDYCFWLSGTKYGIQGDSILEADNLNGSCADGFYTIENGSTVQNIGAFQPFYMKEASRYQSPLAQSSTEWLSPLIGRTLQLIFAGATTTVWQSFSSDFQTLSQAHPNANYRGIDPGSIQETIQKQLSRYFVQNPPMPPPVPTPPTVVPSPPSPEEAAGARNTQRLVHIQSILNAVRQNMADHSDQVFSCDSGAIPTTTRRMASSGSSSYDIASCVVPTDIMALPFDPSLAGAHYTSKSDYDTGYNIFQNSSTLKITLSAPGAELGKSISVMR